MHKISPDLSFSTLRVFDLGLVDYLYAYDFQRNIVAGIKYNKSPDAIIICQHPSVITIGRQGKKENILISKDLLRNKNINVYEVDRGGDITLHNPGQLVVYPVFDLHHFKTDLKWFMDKLESTVISVLRKLNIHAQSMNGRRGVWINDEKIASIGIGVKSWITYHGLSLNVCNDLSEFSYIKPCGLDIKMTSIQKQWWQDIIFDDVKEMMLTEIRGVFEREECLCQK